MSVFSRFFLLCIRGVTVTFNCICCVCLCFSFSLFGVCLMAFHQAQYILNEFSTPSVRSNHNSVLSRDNGPVNNITPNGVKYVQSFSGTVYYLHQDKYCKWIFFLVLNYFNLSFLCFVCAVKQRAVVRAMWTPVTPQTKVRDVVLQPWPTAPPRVLSPQREAP